MALINVLREADTTLPDEQERLLVVLEKAVTVLDGDEPAEAVEAAWNSARGAVAALWALDGDGGAVVQTLMAADTPAPGALAAIVSLTRSMSLEKQLREFEQPRARGESEVAVLRERLAKSERERSRLGRELRTAQAQLRAADRRISFVDVAEEPEPDAPGPSRVPYDAPARLAPSSEEKAKWVRPRHPGGADNAPSEGAEAAS